MIHRLAKTTPYIGGQVRLDLILNRHEDGLTYVDDIHVVPVSDNVQFNEGNSWNTLRYSHTDNIKHLYDVIGNDMFNAPQERNTDKWLYNNTGAKMDTIDHTYCMGIRRMRYQRYGKQFSYFSPMWMYGNEGSFNLDRIRFELCVYNDEMRFRNSVCNVRFSDAAYKYIDDYLRIIDDKLLNINFDTSSCYIDGIHTPSGTHLNRETDYLLYNMLLRERPLMEFDYLIADTFIQNCFIAKQIVNFNFVFNFDDILPDRYTEYLHRDLNVVCKAYYDEEEVTVKDLHSNYDFIPAYTVRPTDLYLGGSFDKAHNVLGYKYDYLCKDTIYDNRIVQPICHWSPESSPDYTWNMYNGFSPVFDKGNGNVIHGSGRYYSTPDMSFDTYDPALFNINWCVVNDLRFASDPLQRISNMRDTKYYTNMGNAVNGIAYHNGIKYDYSTLDEDVNPDDYNVCICILSDDDYQRAIANSEPEQEPVFIYINIDGIVFMLHTTNGYIAIITSPDNVDMVTFSSLRKLTEEKIDEYYRGNYRAVLTVLIKMLKCAQYPYRIRYESTVDPYYTSGPKIDNTSTQEIDYYTTDRTIELYRYSDKLVPQLIDPVTQDDIDNFRDWKMFNYTYRYVQWSEDSNDNYDGIPASVTTDGDGNVRIPLSTYNKYLNTGYMPWYPSVGYSALLRSEYVFDTIPEFYEDDEGHYFVEIPWYDKSIVNNMRPSEVVHITWDWSEPIGTRARTKEDLIDAVWDRLYRHIWMPDAADDVQTDTDIYYNIRMNFLKTIYSYTIKQEYTSLYDVQRYDYTFTFTLK